MAKHTAQMAQTAQMIFLATVLGVVGAAVLPSSPAWAQARLPAPQMQVETQCRAGVAVFRIRNVGDHWPGAAELRVIGPDGETILMERRMRFARGQTATLKFRNAHVMGGPVSLFIRPGWTSSPLAKPDAKADCS